MSKKNALGRGLGALISDAGTSASNYSENKPIESIANEIELSQIEVNPNQPRTKFDETALNELSDSIKQLGVIQPITIREVEDGKYQIISGERRYRATKLAGLSSIPAYIRKANDEEMLAMALVENVQREDLDAIEIAVSYQRMLDECNLTQEQLSERVGKKRSTVANYLRLIKLPPEIQLGIINNDISMGHARALVNIEDADLKVKIFTQIIEEDLSVRKTEELIRNYKNEITETNETSKPKKKILPDEYIMLQNQLKEKFKANIKLKRNDEGKGEIVIPFTSNEELERLIGMMDNFIK
jgi:ParB family transcriptional regulator, chromosome partitioning protein